MWAIERNIQHGGRETEDFVQTEVISDFFVFSAPFKHLLVWCHDSLHLHLHPTPFPSHSKEGVTMPSTTSTDLDVSPALAIFRRVRRIAKGDY